MVIAPDAGVSSAAVVAVHFTQNLRRHVDCPSVDAEGATVRAVLEQVFAAHPALRGYVLEDQGELRKHVTVFVNGVQVHDRQGLSDPVGATDEVYVMQALSGG